MSVSVPNLDVPAAPANAQFVRSPNSVPLVSVHGRGIEGISDSSLLDLSQIKSEICKSKVMIVDDEELIIRVVRRFLTNNGYENFFTLTDPRETLKAISEHQPDLVLLDINMPHLTGIDILRMRSESTELQLIPFIVLSANAESQVRQEALKLGATDFLNKPVESSELALRVQNALTIKRYNDCLTVYANRLESMVIERTQLLTRSREHIIHCLARAAEYRDNETGAHVIRVGKFSALIAEQLGLSNSYCRQIELAAQLHDVGKIGVPDSILLNHKRLTVEEFEVMKTHCQIGTNIIAPVAASEAEQVRRHSTIGGLIMEGTDSPLMEMAVEIAKTHHEKWDGTGYPSGLAGESIPLSGRIVCVADVFDALCSERPYKPKFSMKKCLEIMISERATRFDPQVLDAFFARLVDIERIRRSVTG
jgi:putative two-component system response regulator